MPLNVLPEKFHSFPKITTELEDLEKVDLFNGPIPGKIVLGIIFYFILNYFLLLKCRRVLDKVSSKY